MTFKSLLAATAATLMLAAPALADDSPRVTMAADFVSKCFNDAGAMDPTLCEPQAFGAMADMMKSMLALSDSIGPDDLAGVVTHCAMGEGEACMKREMAAMQWFSANQPIIYADQRTLSLFAACFLDHYDTSIAEVNTCYDDLKTRTGV
jgi:hypothetical protein